MSRDIRIDLAWTTDANGNATINVPLPVTGNWYNLKFALQTPGAPHYTVFVAGTPLTHGSGQRATLGPELIRDGEKVIIQVIGAVGNVQGIGSANGKAGPPDEIVAGFSPAPNTLSVEIASLTGQAFIVELNTAGTSSIVFLLPPLIQNIVCVGRTVSAPSTVTVTGQASGKSQTQNLNTAGQILTFPASIFSLIDFNSLGANVAIFGNCVVDVYLQLGSMVSPVNTDKTPLYVTGSTVGPITVQEGNAPPPWQSPLAKPGQWQNQAIAAGGNLTLIAGVAAQNIWLFEFDLDDIAADAAQFCDIETTDGLTILHQFVSHPGGHDHKSFNGFKVTPTGVGVRIHNFGGAGITVSGSLTNSQQ